MGNSLAFIRPVLLANQHCCGLIIPTRPDVAWSLCQCVCLSLVTRVKLEFGTDTDTYTDILANFPVQLATSRTRTTILADLSDARFSSRGCPLGMRACTRVRVLYTISYRVHVYKITR